MRKLTELQKKILQTISLHPTLSHNKLARMIGCSQPYLSQVVKEKGHLLDQGNGTAQVFQADLRINEEGDKLEVLVTGRPGTLEEEERENETMFKIARTVLIAGAIFAVLFLIFFV